MTKIKNNFFCFSMLIITMAITSCEDDPYKDPDNLELPPITMEGKNTFGCKINGKVWVPYVENPGLFNQKLEETVEPPSIAIQAIIRKDEDKFWQNLSVYCVAIDTGTYQTIGLVYRKNIISTTCNEYSVKEENSRITLIKLDFNQRIVSGTFEYKDIYNDCGDTLQITEGRFDIRY